METIDTNLDAKEKAQELVGKIQKSLHSSTAHHHEYESKEQILSRAKTDAIMAVDVILFKIRTACLYYKDEWCLSLLALNKEYWLGVRVEIENCKA